MKLKFKVQGYQTDAVKAVVDSFDGQPMCSGLRYANVLQRRPLPVALDLASLHAQLVQQHIPLAARPGETLAQQVARFSSLRAAKARYAKLQTRINNERQFNRKVALNAQMRDLSAEILALESSDGSKA